MHYVYIYVYTHIYIYTHIYLYYVSCIYIYIERERGIDIQIYRYSVFIIISYTRTAGVELESAAEESNVSAASTQETTFWSQPTRLPHRTLLCDSPRSRRS